MIWQDKRDGGDLWRSLRRRGKRYNKRAGKNAGRGLIPNRIDISERPAIVVRKTRLGDWEGDTVVSAGGKGGLLTLVERKTKLTKIAKLPRATARATQKAAVRRIKPIADFVHTIAFDNGKEFAAHQDITHALKVTVFFATPYHAWERGLNENTNGVFDDSNFHRQNNVARELYALENRSPKGLATEEATAYWDRLRFLQQKSARARKRAEERQCRPALRQAQMGFVGLAQHSEKRLSSVIHP
jgi:hypothetical protein